jgi:hypothetical protein
MEVPKNTMRREGKGKKKKKKSSGNRQRSQNASKHKILHNNRRRSNPLISTILPKRNGNPLSKLSKNARKSSKKPRHEGSKLDLTENRN